MLKISRLFKQLLFKAKILDNGNAKTLVLKTRHIKHIQSKEILIL